MTIDKQKLKDLAEAAVPGPWECREAEGSSAVCWERGWVADSCTEQDILDNRYIAAASPATVLALLAEIEEDAMHMRAFGEVMRSQAEQLEQLKADNEALRKDAELVALGRAKLAGAMSRLRAKHNDWTAPEALPAAELVWCACGDGFPPNSYGAGFMDANNGVCWSCDAAKAVSHD